MLDLESTAANNAMFGSFPLLYKLGRFLPMMKRAQAISDRLREYAEQSLERYRRVLENDPEKVQKTLFTKLYQGIDDETLTHKEINDEAQIYIVAGSDTTANTLTYLTWRLCLPENRHIKYRLLKELDTLPESDFSDSDLKHLPYLGNIISETLRLHAAVPGGLRRVVPEGGAVIGGYQLPAGGEVMTNCYSIHRNAQVFPDPETFDPDRWENPSKEMKDAFLPYGGGSRGKSYTTTFSFVPAIIQFIGS